MQASPATAADADAISALLAGETPSAAESNPSLHFSGWMDGRGMLFDSRENHPAYIDVHHLYLIGDAQLSPIWRAFFELEIEHLVSVQAPSLNASDGSVDGSVGEFKVDRVYLEAKFFPELLFRAGKLASPMGLRIPAHWTVLTPVIEKPVFEDNEYVPLKNVGLQAYGTFNKGELQLDYSAFLSNGSEINAPNEPLDNLTGFGAMLQATLHGHYLLGASVYRQRRFAEAGRQEITLLPYLELKLPLRLSLRGEYFHQWREGASPIDAWYFLLQYQVHQLDKVSLTFRISGGVDEKRAGGGHQTIYTGNISYRPIAAVRLALEFSQHDFLESTGRDYSNAMLWAGVIF